MVKKYVRKLWIVECQTILISLVSHDLRNNKNTIWNTYSDSAAFVAVFAVE